jgi:[ribosomal protein S5]-alanine N-acetyltransferase
MIDLTDGVVLLRAWRLEDAEWYASQSKDADIQQNTTEPANLTSAVVAEAIRRYADDPRHVGWAICDATTGELLGNLALDLPDGEVSYWLAGPARGRGVATRAVNALAAYAFGAHHLHELKLWTRRGNSASANVARRAGFVRAPNLDKTIEARGESWPAECYRLTPDALPS